MPRAAIAAILSGLVLLCLLFLGNPFFIVREGTQVVVTRFGEPVGGAISKAGLHMKTPFTDNVNRFEKRVLEWDGDPNQIPTKDKRFIWIDTTARWRIVDPLKFLQTVGDELGAQARLDDIIDSVTRDAITSQPLNEIVRSTNRDLTENILEEESGEGSRLIRQEKVLYGRDRLTNDILTRAREMTPRYGIEIVDVRIKRIVYVEEVLEKIYERMISERKRAAEKFRSEGFGRQAEIEGRTEKDLNEVRSDAYRKSQEIMGRADAKAAKIYADAYGKNTGFYEFRKKLETYEKTIDKSTTLVLSTSGDYFSLLREPGIQS